jgi:MFS family permease
LLPYFFPDMNTAVLVWSLIAILALSSASAHFGVPIWFSWMSDILPHRSLGEYWARRRRWQSIVSMATLASTAWFFWEYGDIDIRTTFMIISMFGALAGIVDIVLFWNIPEPKMARHETQRLRQILDPFLDADFRRFIFFWAYWAFTATFAFIFFRLYMLEYVGWSVAEINLLFGFHALGGTLFAARIGRWVDRVGCRPVIVLFTLLKSVVVIGIFLMRPGYTILPLIPIFIFDNFLNTGIFVAQNNYMLKHSPRRGRPMYVAAVMATSGLVGGLAAMLSGRVLESVAHLGKEPAVWLGLTWTHFHVVFAISIVFRWFAILVAWRIREPKAKEPGDLLIETVVPTLVHWFTLPLGFFSRGREDRSDNSNKR